MDKPKETNWSDPVEMLEMLRQSAITYGRLHAESTQHTQNLEHALLDLALSAEKYFLAFVDGQ